MTASSAMIDRIVDVCHRLYAKGFVAATDGNVSVRLSPTSVLTTRSSVNKGLVTADDLVEVDAGGKVQSAGRAPSTELPMHLYIYHHRPDIQAVVHAHPPYATGFAAAGQALDQCLLPEVIVGLGAVPLAPYATPSTGEVGESLAPFVGSADAILLANHGVVAYGSDIMEAYFKMEKVEHAAHITFIARMLGGEQRLSKEEIEKLRAVSIASYGKDFSEKPACAPSSKSSIDEEQPVSEEHLRDIVRAMLRLEQ